jgi:FtsH-binding integral membrane protein
LYFAPTFGAACLLAVLTAAFNASFVKFTINGDPVTGHEFLRAVGPAFLVLGVLALAIAYSIWQERSWTRWLILGFWAAGLAVNIGLGWANSGARGAVSAIAGLAVVLLLVGWYLFGKENVVEYFHAVERQEGAHPLTR